MKIKVSKSYIHGTEFHSKNRYKNKTKSDATDEWSQLQGQEHYFA